MTDLRDRHEIRVEAAVGGRRLTLDPIREKTIEVSVREVETTIPCGFQVNHVEGQTDEGLDFEFNSGAGMGSRWMTFKYRGHYVAIDVESLIRPLVAWIDGVEAEQAIGAPTDGPA